LLNAVVQRRVFVSREPQITVPLVSVEESHIREPELDAPLGVPTLQRVEAALTLAGYHIGNRDGEVMVDEQNYGRVRVRAAGYNHEKQIDLANLQKVLNVDYATMHTRGSGSCSWDTELQVWPLSTTKDYYYREHRSHIELPVQHAMIREDVWQ